MNHATMQRIRRAAILVASLEETLAEQLLNSLPPAESQRVLAELERLESVDPEEQQDVLDEFRNAGRSARSREDGVEFTYSAPRAMMPLTSVAAEANVSAGEPSHVEDVRDAELIAELLSPEHPQTIAAALSRMGNEQGAAVFAALPPTLQNEVLDRIASLTIADEEAVNELETQLRRRVDEHRQRRERLAASIDMARRMLARTSPQQRATLLARLAPEESEAVARVDHAGGGQHAPSPPAWRASREAARRFDDARFTAIGGGEADGDSAGGPAAAEGPHETEPEAHAGELDDRSQQLLALDDYALTAAMRSLDELTVLRSLAASSDEFLNRLAQRLPRRQASKLRQLVRTLAPTQLAELRRSQHEFLSLARQCAAEAAV